MTTMINGLSSDFAAEIKAKQDAFDVTQIHLRAATRELAEQRKQIQAWQTRCGELDQVIQRVRNLEQALVDEDKFDWTGRLTLEGKDAGPGAGPAFQWRGLNSTMAALGGSVDISFNLDPEPTMPLGDSVTNLIRLRRLKSWHQRVEELTEGRLKNLQGASAEKEFQCKKIVAMCTGVPIDKVEEVGRSSVSLVNH
jgi:regulatory protein SWI6